MKWEGVGDKIHIAKGGQLALEDGVKMGHPCGKVQRKKMEIWKTLKRRKQGKDLVLTLF